MEHNVAAAIKVYGYELGNEPSCYMAKVGITGAQSAADFGRLTSLLHNVYGQQQQQQQQPRESMPLEIGPLDHGTAKTIIMMRRAGMCKRSTTVRLEAGNSMVAAFTLSTLLPTGRAPTLRAGFFDCHHSTHAIKDADAPSTANARLAKAPPPIRSRWIAALQCWKPA